MLPDGSSCLPLFPRPSRPHILGATQPPTSAAWSFSQGSARKFVSCKGASPVTITSSSSASSTGRQGNGCRVANVEATEYFSSESQGECPPSQKILQERPIYAYNTDQHRDEHERHSECKREHQTPSWHPPLNSPERVLPDLPAFVGMCTKSSKASAWCSWMGDVSTSSSEVYKKLRMTRSSM